jgi:hypothetical protein
MSLLNVTFDASKLEAWASELSTRGFRNAIRRALDQSARAARKLTIPIIAADIGVSKAKIAAAVPKVVASKAGDLSARWTISKLRIGILNTAGATVSRQGGLTASTHKLTGGGSASLNVAKAFIIKANGGSFVAFRKSKERLPIKAIYAESPATAMGQDGAAAQVAWQNEANKQLATRLPVEVQKQLVAEGLSAATPDNSAD